jgi:hypothetical protein
MRLWLPPVSVVGARINIAYGIDFVAESNVFGNKDPARKRALLLAIELSVSVASHGNHADISSPGIWTMTPKSRIYHF